MVNVKTYKCFPTSIHEVKLNIETHDRTNMLTYIKRDEEDDNLHTMSYFKSLTNKILECSEKILKDGDYEFEKIEITNMWGNLLNKGNSHAPHTHSNNILSGVYYLESDETAGIQFFDPRPQAHSLFPNIEESVFENSGMLQFNSTKGHGIIFPAWLQHWVPKTNNDRISISWNILLRGDYGQPGTLQNSHI